MVQEVLREVVPLPVEYRRIEALEEMIGKFYDVEVVNERRQDLARVVFEILRVAL